MHERPQPARHRLVAKLAGACVVLAAVAATAAAPAGAASAPPPSPAALLLQISDFAGSTKVVRRVPGDIKSYRIFGPGLRMGSVWLLAVYSGAVVHGGPDSARRQFVDETRRLARRAERIDQVGDLWAFLFGKAVRPQRTRVGPLLSAGSDARYFMGSMTFGGRTVRVGMATLRVDRAVASVEVLGLVDEDLYKRNIERLVAVARERMREAFAVTVATPPSIVGTAGVGQVLVVDEGSWTGAPSFSYVWSRCNESGSACLPVEGETNRTYFIEPDDVGTTLRVTVRGTNTLAAIQATTPVTKLVTG